MKRHSASLRLVILSATAAAALAAPSAFAQNQDPINDVIACQQIADQAARLACFDAAAARLSDERDNGLVAIYRQDVEAVERDSFGFDLPSMPRLSFSLFANSGDSPDPLDPSTTPERMAAAEAGETVPPAQSMPQDTTPPSAAEPTASGEDEDEGRGLFARLLGRGGDEAETPASQPVDRAPVNGVQVVERDDEGAVERVAIEIERIRELAYNRHRFYMANGQVWEQSGAGRISYDDDGPNFAEIRRAALDSYLMQINGRGRAIRVQRVR